MDDAGDDVVESRFDAGVDLVQSSISFKLSNAVENLTLTGSDNIDGTGNSQSNIVIGNSGNNVLKTGKGGFDTLIGGQGDDTYIEHVRSSGLSVVERPGGGTDTLKSFSGFLPDNVENLILLDQDDPFVGYTPGGRGNSLDNVIVGSPRGDFLDGREGNDTLFGHAGDDKLEGYIGQDVLDGGLGADAMFGGQGDDIYIGDNSADRAIEFKNQGIDLVRSTSDFTLLPNVENLDLMGADDINGTGNNIANVITGNLANNILSGANGDDTLSGERGEDRISGGGGNDELTGGFDRDILRGGAGADRFVYTSLLDTGLHAARDRIGDFQPGVDTIDLSAIDADASAAGDQAFVFVGSADFSRTAGELHAVEVAGKILVEGDVDGDGAADFQILLAGLPALTAGDFVLSADGRPRACSPRPDADRGGGAYMKGKNPTGTLAHARFTRRLRARHGSRAL